MRDDDDDVAIAERCGTTSFARRRMRRALGFFPFKIKVRFRFSIS
jgi:hypothetical protein